MVLLLYALSFAAGAGGSIQSSMNAALSRTIGIFEAAAFSVMVTFSSLAVITLVVTRGAGFSALGTAPPYFLFAGLFATVFLIAANKAIPEIGTAGFIVAAVVGQLVAGVVLDHFGAFGHAPHPIDLARGLGLALLLVGMKLIIR